MGSFIKSGSCTSFLQNLFFSKFLLAFATIALIGAGTPHSAHAATTVVSCNSNTIQTAINTANDGDTIQVTPGTCTWKNWVSFSNSKGVSLICQTPGACNISSKSTVLGMNGNLSGINTHFYRISGFNISGGGSGVYSIWFDTAYPGGSGTLTQLRIDHNTFTLAPMSTAIFFGDTTAGAAYYYGVIDHNTLTSTGSAALTMWIGGGTDPNPPSAPQGTANNMFVEDNTITIQKISNAGEGCSDAWGGANYVWRHNTTVNCLIAAHGSLHGGGPQNWEYYNNTQSLNSGSAGSGVQDGYRQFHHQGSGEFIAFNNTFLSYSGKNSDVIEMMYYRDEASVAASEDGTVCDGTQQIDGNRTPTTSYYGYPCWHQPARDFAGNLQPIYVWNNKWADTGAKIDMTMNDIGGYFAYHHIADRDNFNAVGDMQTSPTSPFDGTTGTGFGTLANRPTTCSVGLTDPLDAGKGGVGYFATDVGPQGTLYQCSSPNTWVVRYQPYAYPHPLTNLVSDTTPPTVPTGLTATAISASQINLSWTASTDDVAVSGYSVYRNGALVGSTSATSYSDIGLTGSTAYTYTVLAYDASGNRSAQSTSASATTLQAVVNGACGSSNGMTLSAAPTTNLCSAGTASAVAGTGPWTWSCTGSNGGTNASCSAALQSSGGGGTSYSVLTTQQPAMLGNTDCPTCNYELGMRFSSSVAGNITAIRFWKDSNESGTHTGHIWSNTGTLLATVTFSGESASGWQTQNLATPLAITAGTKYVVSVNTGAAYYVATNNGFASAISNGPLSSVVGTNGIYGTAGKFPTTTWQASNYFRDVVFTTN